MVLRAEEQFVDGVDPGEPVAVRNFAGRLDVALASYEIPQEVPPVHEVHLIGEKEFQVLCERRHGNRFIAERDLTSFDLHPVLVSLDVGRFFRVHARKEEFELRIVFVSAQRLRRFVFPAVSLVIGRFFFVSYRRRRIVGTFDQRSCAVLVAVQQRQQPVGVVRRVAVHRRVRRRPDHDRSVRTVSEDHYGHAQQNRVGQHLSFFMRKINAPCQRGEQRESVDRDSAVEKPVEQCAQLDRSGNDDEHGRHEDRGGNQQRLDDSPFGHAVFAEIVDQYDRRNDQ